METLILERKAKVKNDIGFKSCNILGVEINVVDMKGTVNFISENIKKLSNEYICVSNVHTTVMAHDNEEYRNIQNSAILRLPDGKPLSIVSKKRGFTEAERVTGPDLMIEIFKLSESKGYTHYFYGSTAKTLNLLKKELLEQYPKLNIVGIYSPPFRELTEEENKRVVVNINKANADFVWVGLGAPKQEKWMYENKEKINSLMIGVGAGFDYHAGTIKRAPEWMQKLSLEWLYRLMQDPRRLFKRYLTTNISFIHLLKKNNTF